MSRDDLINQLGEFDVGDFHPELCVRECFNDDPFDNYIVVFAHELAEKSNFTDKKRVDSTLSDFVLQEKVCVFRVNGEAGGFGGDFEGFQL